MHTGPGGTRTRAPPSRMISIPAVAPQRSVVRAFHVPSWRSSIAHAALGVPLPAATSSSAASITPAANRRGGAVGAAPDGSSSVRPRWTSAAPSAPAAATPNRIVADDSSASAMIASVSSGRDHRDAWTRRVRAARRGDQRGARRVVAPDRIDQHRTLARDPRIERQLAVAIARPAERQHPATHAGHRPQLANNALSPRSRRARRAGRRRDRHPCCRRSACSCRSAPTPSCRRSAARASRSCTSRSCRSRTA